MRQRRNSSVEDDRARRFVRWWRVTAAIASFGVLLSVVTPAAGDRFRGRRLSEVLEELRADGLQFVYSSTLVPPDLRVTVEPTADEPLARLEQMLRPLGLTARATAAGAYSIVSLASATLAGTVVDASGRPVEGAVIRLGDRTAVSGADGSFRLGPVPAGAQDVQVRARGYETLTHTGWILTPATPAVTFQLRPLHTFVTEVVVTPGTRSVVLDDPTSSRGMGDDDTVLVPTFGGDVSRVIETLPGVAAPDNSAAFNVRGSLAQDVSLVLDGMELYEPFHLRSFQSPFSTIDADIVDRIDFFGGGWTSELGDRHGGFIRLSTEEAAADSRRGELELGTLNSRFSYGAPLPGVGGGWIASARAWYPEALRDSIELGESGLSPRFSDAYFKVVGRAGQDSMVSAHGLFAVDDIDFVEGDGNEAVDSNSQSGYLWLRWLYAPAGRLSADTVLSMGRIDRVRDGLSEPEDDPLVVRDERDLTLFGLRSDLTWQWGDRHLLRSGVELRWLEAGYDYLTGDPGDLEPPLRLNPSGTSAGAYVAYRARAARTLSTEVGLRWDRQSYTDETQWSPRFNAVWRPGDRTVLRLGAGLFHQSQRIHELRVEDGETEFLPAERSRQFELTVQHRLPGDLQFRADLYDRKLTRVRPRFENFFNPVELFPETESDRLRIAPDRARLRGVELLLRGSTEGAVSWWIAYTLSAAEDAIDGRHVPRSWDQPHAFRFLVGYRRGETWSLSLSGAAHEGWPSTPVTAEVVVEDGVPTAEPVLGERNSDRFRDYLRIDLKFSRRFDVRRGKLRLDFEVINLTDRSNVCCVDEAEAILLDDGTAQPVRELQDWLGITPSLGIVWEF